MTINLLKKKRRRINISNNSENLSSPSRPPLVYNYESEEDEIIHQESHDLSKNDQHEGYISQPNSPNISKVVEPLKRKAPLSEYWLNYPRASSSAHADVKVTISEKVIALWKGDNTDKTSIEVSIEDADLHEFGKFLSSKLLYYHPLIPFSKASAALETKKKLLSHARIVMGNLITNADYHVSSHKDFFYDFDKHYIRPI